MLQVLNVSNVCASFVKLKHSHNSSNDVTDTSTTFVKTDVLNSQDYGIVLMLLKTIY